MLRSLCLVTAVLVLQFESAFAQEGTPHGGNAALKYWQAFATLPKFTDAENKTIGECLTAPLDDSVRKMLKNAEYSLEMLHRGSSLRQCDWGMSYEDGVFALLPHASASRVLSSLACLRGRVRFKSGQNAEAIDDLVAAMTLGRHVSIDGSLITVLVGYSIEHRAIETLAQALPTLDPKAILELKTRFDALPPFGTEATALLVCEKETLEWFIRKVKDTKDKESLLAFLSWIGVSEDLDRDTGGKAAAFLKECGGTADGVIKFAIEALPSYDIMAKMLELPLDEFEKEFDRESTRQSGNPVFKIFFPALAKSRQSSVRATVRRTLFLTAMSVQMEGQNALKNQLDPVGSGPFEHTSFKGGFELRSKMKGQDGKPITLTVGHRG